MTKVVITGIGAITPFGKGTEALWDGIRQGKSGAGPITGFDASDYRCQIAAEVLDWDGTDRIDPRQARQMDRFCQFGVWAAHEAVENAGLQIENEDPYRVGVNVGSGIGGLWEHETQIAKINKKGPRFVSPYYIPKNITNIAAGWISILHGLKGYSSAPVVACATSAIAMGDAANLIRWGKADVMVTGGTEGAITPVSVAGFSNMKALALGYNDNPTKASRPFDRDREGFVMGEGAVVYVMESQEHAQARGAEVLAEVAGFGATSDAHHITAPNLDGEAPAAAMRLALEDAQIPKGAVDYINAHGTSTPYNDKMESTAIHKAFGDVAKEIPVSSTKSMHGHLLGAAAAVEAAACILAIKEGFIPPTINLDSPDPECDLDHVPCTPREKEVHVALSNSFAFGGHNGCLVFRRV
ncbi:beta-ketoacyl-ACP synthase II [bacterium]|nr:beta-ketoacyl-ACP synthase II [bacterium]